jgi:hypothetical protein
MGIGASANDRARARPLRAITAIAASALVVSGVIGLGAGYKIEQQRLASGVKRLRTQVANRASQGTSPTTSPASSRSGLGE